MARAEEVEMAAMRVNSDPSDVNARVQLSAVLIRSGHYTQAGEQLDICLAMCPPGSRKRLLVVVLRARLRNAARRWAMWS